MGRGWDPSWRDYDPRKRMPLEPDQSRTADQVTAKKKLDRGSRRGARRCVVVDLTLYEAPLAKALGLKGENFQSIKEATRWISLLQQERAGGIRNLRRQVAFSLQARGPHGLMVHVCKYVADFVYDEKRLDSCSSSDTILGWGAGEWINIVEDTKPGIAKKGAFREDTYLLKRRWFEAQFGKQIRET